MLDPTFGIGGKVITDFQVEQPASTEGRSVATVDIDGEEKIVVLGDRFNLARYHSDGSLDTSFGDGGTKIVEFRDGHSVSMAVRPNGSVLIAGYFENYGTGQDFAIAQLTPQGQLDTSFGVGGKQIVDFGQSQDQADRIIFHNNAILVVGTTTQVGSGTHFAIARLTNTGGMDSSFDGDGKEILSRGGNNEYASGVVVQQDGKILIAGTSDQGGLSQAAMIVRLESNGDVDTTFGTQGQKVMGFYSFSSIAGDIALEPDGAIVLAGNVRNFFFVARLTPSGNYDPNFYDNNGGQLGRTLINPDGSDFFNSYGYQPELIRTLAIQPDRTIVIAGGGKIARFTYYSHLDRPFGNGGGVQFGIPRDSAIGGAVLQADGRIVFAGSEITQGNRRVFKVGRLNTDGHVDSSFGDSGSVATPFQSLNSSDTPVQIVSAPNGKTVVLGISQTATFDLGKRTFVLSRYNADGSLDAQFGGGDGKQSIDVDFLVDVINSQTSVTVLPDERIVVAGTIASDTGNRDFAVVRLLPSGERDTSFSGDGLQTIDFAFQTIAFPSGHPITVLTQDAIFGVAVHSIGAVAGRDAGRTGGRADRRGPLAEG